MLRCHNCRHKKKISGDAHIECSFPWKEQRKPQLTRTFALQWFLFPFNFDPLWGDNCDVFEKRQ